MENNTIINQIERIKELRESLGVNRTEFARQQGIPLRTVEEWEAGRRKMPDYVLRLLAYKVRMENNNSNPISIVSDAEGRKIVLVNDIRFKSRRKIDWNQVEEYLKEYIGKCYEIIETSEKVYISKDFPDEFCHSTDKTKLRGANEKAKANITPVIGELIKIATNKAVSEDFENRHGKRAKLGWYRYDTRFGIPVYNDDGELERYNIFSTRMLVRVEENGSLYLYDFVRTKKETSSPLEQ